MLRSEPRERVTLFVHHLRVGDCGSTGLGSRSESWEQRVVLFVHHHTLHSSTVTDQAPVWAPYDVLRAEDIARLPAAERGPWENRTGSPRLCISCKRDPATRDDERLPPSQREGAGFYTCAHCRLAAAIRATLNSRITPVASANGRNVARYQAQLASLDKSSNSDPRHYALSPNIAREQGLCRSCKAQPALPRRRCPGDEELRALAELRDTTVARLSTGQYCADCKPESSRGYQSRAGIQSGTARRLRTWKRDQDILERLDKSESSHAIAKAKGIDHSTVLRVKKRHEARLLEDPAEHAGRSAQRQSALEAFVRSLEMRERWKD